MAAMFRLEPQTIPQPAIPQPQKQQQQPQHHQQPQQQQQQHMQQPYHQPQQQQPQQQQQPTQAVFNLDRTFFCFLRSRINGDGKVNFFEEGFVSSIYHGKFFYNFGLFCGFFARFF
jgi:hemolysin activation/secretion protein